MDVAEIRKEMERLYDNHRIGEYFGGKPLFDTPENEKKYYLLQKQLKQLVKQ